MARDGNTGGGGGGGGSATAKPPQQQQGAGGGGASQDEVNEAMKRLVSANPISRRPAVEPRLGDQVVYVLGSRSPNAGEERVGFVSLVHDVPEPQREDKPGLVNVTWLIGKPTTDLPAHPDGKPRDATSPMYFSFSVEYDATGAPGTWHWPEGSPQATAKPKA